MEDRAALHPARLGWSLLALGTVAALLFCFLLYPRLQGVAQANLDPDDYGRIAQNLVAGHGLTIDPQRGPTVYRGPGYPAFVALATTLGGGRYPQSVWVAQSILHGVLASLTYLLSLRWFGGPAGHGIGRRVGLVAGGLVAIYPAILWYTPRLWNEGLLAVLLLGFLWCATHWFQTTSVAGAARRNATWICILAGLVLGAATLTKGVFLPWIFLAPGAMAWLFWRAARREGDADPPAPLASLPWIAIVGLLCVLPWTVRNHDVSGSVVPVHTGAAFNVVVGQALSRELSRVPLGYGELWDAHIREVFALTDGLQSQGALREIGKERIYREVALREAREHPLAVARHAAFSALSFWFLGETPAKTALLCALRLPVLVLGGLGLVRALRSGSPALELAAAGVLVYWLSHVPFAPPVRLSLPVVPVLCIFAAAVTLRAPFRYTSAMAARVSVAATPSGNRAPRPGESGA